MVPHLHPQAMSVAVRDIGPKWKESNFLQNQGPDTVMTKSLEEVIVSLDWKKSSVKDLASVCQKCRNEKSLVHAKSIYMHVRSNGLSEDLGNYVVPMFVECGSLHDAQHAFDKLIHKNEFSWCSLLKGYFDQGDLHQVLHLFEQMQDSGVRQSRHSLLTPLKACSKLKSIEKCQYVHDVIFKEGLEEDRIIGNTVIDMYVKCGLPLDAVEVFNKLHDRDVVSWNALIRGYIEQGLTKDALESLEKMKTEGMMADNVTLLCMMKVFSSKEYVENGRDVHDMVVKQGLERERFIGNALVDMYIKCGLPSEARRTLDKLPSRDVVSWTALISGYVDNGFSEEALICFEEMKKEGISPNSATFLCSLKACSSIGDIERGRAIQSDIPVEIFIRDTSLGNSLIDMYAKCGALHEAQQVFQQLPIRNIISWNALLAGYTEHGFGDDALDQLAKMHLEGMSPDASTLNCCLKACGIIGSLVQSQEMHDIIVMKGLENANFIGNTLVDVYTKCGLLAEAQYIFNELSVRTVVSWTALIAGYTDHGKNREALNCLDQMQAEGISPNPVTSACCLKACTNVGDIKRGQEIHLEVTKKGDFYAEFVGESNEHPHKIGVDSNQMRLGNALIDMYGKCGNVFSAQKVFDEMPVCSLVTWNALITGYSRQGHSEAVFIIFDEMKIDGSVPDGITFLSLLSVCSHVGLVNKARNYFEMMSKDYDISPTIEHYNCMVDILGRAGQLKEAISMMNKMPYQPTIVAWSSVLAACRKWRNVKLGRYAFDSVVKLDKEHGPAFILMFNIYVDAHMYDEANQIEAMMHKTLKEQGQSWIEIGGIVYNFTTPMSCINHVQNKAIYRKLQEIHMKMEKERPDSVPFHSSDDGVSCRHTEKLAAIFGLLNTSDGTPIRIMKNLRVCGDCHMSIAFISKMEVRNIICKDISCFHEFKQGKCSCGGHW